MKFKFMVRNIREIKMDLSTIVANVANRAYSEVAQKYSEYLQDPKAEAVYMEGDKCQQVSEQARGIFIQEYKLPVEYVYMNEGNKHHVYLLVNNSHLFDGTWQSFLDKYRKDTPYLFIEISRLETELERLKVPKNLWSIWLNYAQGLKKKKAA